MNATCASVERQSSHPDHAPVQAVCFKEPLHVFSRISVDYAGLFTTVQGRGKCCLKHYMCLFKCNSLVTDEELMTAFTGVDSLKSCPLTYQSANLCDDVPLTPSHLLYGQVK